MSDKSIARLEMELDKLKDEKAAIKAPSSGTGPAVFGLLGAVILVVFDSYIVGFVMLAIGFFGVLVAFVSRGTHKRLNAEVDEKIHQVREQIVRAKEILT